MGVQPGIPSKEAISFLHVKNWETFQHYKDRSPPWIKLHRELLRDYQFSCLQDASKLHLMLIWLLASQLDNRIPNDPAWIKNQIGTSGDVDLKPLIDSGFLIPEQHASNTLADCKQSAMPETEAYKQETYKEEKESAAAPPTIWDAGVAQGLPRSLVGRWIKDHGEGRTAEVIAKLAVKRPADPVQFGTAYLQDRPEKLFVPADNDEMVSWAKANGFPDPSKSEKYDEYRKRLWPLVKERNARMSA